MKRFSFIFTALMIGALVLAACGGGTSSNATPAGNTAGVGTPTVGTGAVGTAAASPTTGAGAAVTGTATVAAGGSTTGTATAPAGTEAAGTPTVAAGTGNVPGTGPKYVLLSQLVAMAVNDKSGKQVGSVSGVIVNSASASGSTGSNSTSGAATTTQTPAATSSAAGATTTQTPAATSSAGSSGSTGVAMGNNPAISYVVVNVSGGMSSGAGSSSSSGAATTTQTPAATSSAGSTTTTQTPAATSSAGSSSSTASGNQVLVPWQAFTVSAATGSVPATGSSSSSSTTTATETPAAGSTTTTQTPAATSSASGTSSMSSTGGALTLTVDQSVLAGAPAFDATAFSGSVSPDVAQYWSGQGLSIPATGNSAAAVGSFLIQSPISAFDVKDSSGKSLGQAKDFVVDTTTGELVYAILSDATGSKFYVVPFSVFSWQAGTSASATGEIMSNATSDKLTAAPSITSIDTLDFTKPDWNSQFDTYWQSVK